jgi:acyl-coenzyme A synthetase/AMP-(fatty) acid ligase
VSLAEIERCLLENPWVKDVAAVGLDDGSRQHVGVVVQLTPAGTAALGRLGRRFFNEALKTALRPRIERVALPRKFRYVDAVPADSQGKRQRALLERLFGSRS